MALLTYTLLLTTEPNQKGSKGGPGFVGCAILRHCCPPGRSTELFQRSFISSLKKREKPFSFSIALVGSRTVILTITRSERCWVFRQVLELFRMQELGEEWEARMVRRGSQGKWEGWDHDTCFPILLLIC